MEESVNICLRFQFFSENHVSLEKKTVTKIREIENLIKKKIREIKLPSLVNNDQTLSVSSKSIPSNLELRSSSSSESNSVSSLSKASLFSRKFFELLLRCEAW